MIYNQVLWDTLCNIDLRFETVDTSVRLVGDHEDTAHAAPTKLLIRMIVYLTFYLPGKALGLDLSCR